MSKLDRKRTLPALLATTALALGTFATFGAANASFARDVIHEQDFSADASDWTDSGGDYGSVTHNAGDETATIDGANDSPDGLIGPFSYFGGTTAADQEDYRETWPEHGYLTELDVYLDPSEMSDGDGFDLSVASSREDTGEHLRDFIFHVGMDDGELLVNGSNNSDWDFNANKLTQGGIGVEIGEAGWYTFQHHFRDQDGSLAVDLNVLDSNGDTVFTTTRSTAADEIDGVVGGARYMWFVYASAEFEIDNQRLIHLAELPDAVAAPEAVAGVESADVSWDAPASEGDDVVTGYQVEVSDDGGATWSVAIADTGSTDTSATVSPLAAGTPVMFRVSAINSFGTADPSPASNEVTPLSVPPTAVTAVAGVVSAEVSWDAPASGDEPVGYRIESSVDDGASWATRVADTGSAATTATVEGLAGDTPTRFRVTALGAGGPSQVSEPSDAVTPAWRDRIGFDSIPTPFPNSLVSLGFQATSTWELGNHIAFDAVSDTLETATVTMVNWAYFSQWEDDGYTAEGFEHPITLNLYEVDADGEAGALIDSVTQDVLIEWRPETTPNCTDKWGATCSNGYAFPVEFDLTGIAVPDEVIFGVAYNTGSHGPDPIGVTGPYNSLNVGLLDDAANPDGVSVGTDVDPDSVHRAVGPAGEFLSSSGWSQYTPAVQFTFAAAAPAAVPAPVATAGEESADVSWDAPASDGGAGITGYQVEVSDDGGDTWSVAIADTGSTDTSATVAPLAAGTPVVFRVSAINAAGTADPSPASNEVTPTAPAVSPPDDDDDDDVDQLPPPVDQLPPGGSGPVFVPVDPERFYDSRTTGAQVPAGEVVEVPVTDVASVPADAPAVVVNVTATRAAMPGFVTVLPCGGDVPEASNLNYQVDRDVAIMAVLPVSDDGTVCLYSSADVDLVLDVTGYAEADGGYAAVAPQRLTDTRTSDGVTAAGSVVAVEPPQTDAEMLSLSVTTTMATEAGYFTVWACGDDQEQPDTSSLNFDAGRDAANLTMVANETICVFTSAESHVIVDLHGLIGPSIGVEPDRLVDTRTSGAPVAVGEPLSVEVDAVPAADGSSYAVMNVTAVDPAGPGFMTVRPCSDPDGESSAVNFVPGTAIANLALVDTSEPVCVTVSAASHVLVDLVATG